MLFALRRPQKILLLFVIVALILITMGLLIFFLVISPQTNKTVKGVVVANGYKCGEIGAGILTKGGNAVDAAIATLFCEGVAMPQSMGLGGGFLMTIYQKKTKKAVSLNAREVAPAAATEDMFQGDSELSTKGGLAVAVPGELKGYWEAYNTFGGKLPWRDLVEPTIKLCKEGIRVTNYLARLFKSEEDNLKKDPILKETFIDPKTNKTYLEGELVFRPRLAKTLEVIAEKGGEVLNGGELTENLVQDIKAKNGIITFDDLKNYKVEWQEPIVVNLPMNQTLFTTPLPGSGVILSFVMNILNDFLDYSQPDSVKNWQRIVESFKFGYGKRTELGDTNFVDIKELISNLTSTNYAKDIRTKIFDDTTSQDPEYYGAKMQQPEDHGTAHICVLSPSGDAVSVTSTVNLYFGAKFMSNSTGVIFNDEMDDFSSPNTSNNFGLPPSEANFIRPGKRPLSSMVPSIVIDGNGDVRLVIGAAGGSKITTAVSQTILKHLWFNYTVQEAISGKRLHHQLVPMTLVFEKAYENETEFLNEFVKIGHKYEIFSGTGFSALTAISRINDSVAVGTDPRRSGDYAFVSA